ncbi:MAG: hypothetical protein EXR79_08835 [Myxococcales bacterium]|nr:hypothetical protein [Myxococcales bacterium]
MTRKLAPLLLTVWALVPARAHAADVDLATLARSAPVTALVQIDDPPSSVADLPVPGAPKAEPYQRYLRHFRLVRTLVGTAPPASLTVDDHAWRRQFAAHVACVTRASCTPPALDTYRGTLAREPAPGQQVLVFLRKTADGWELAADRALDDAARAAEVLAARSRP